MKYKTRPPEELDQLITEKLNELMEKRPSDSPDKQAYADLIKAIAAEQVGVNADEMQLAHGMETLEKCRKLGAKKLFEHDALAMAELFSLGTGIADTFNKRNYPHLTDEQHLLLRIFFSDWNKNIRPLLAERIEAYGREKLAAAGLTRAVKDWLDTKPVRARFEGMLDAHYENNEMLEVMTSLRSMNINIKAETGLSYVCSSLRLNQFPPEHLPGRIELIAENFSADEPAIKRTNIGRLELQLESLAIVPNIGERERNLAKALQKRVKELVVTPFLEVEQILAHRTI